MTRTESLTSRRFSPISGARSERPCQKFTAKCTQFQDYAAMTNQNEIEVLGYGVSASSQEVATHILWRAASYNGELLVQVDSIPGLIPGAQAEETFSPLELESAELPAAKVCERLNRHLAGQHVTTGSERQALALQSLFALAGESAEFEVITPAEHRKAS